ncbi:MAG: 1-phosphofructokinase [Clostridia bacterium]|nr:1-phosphofructokinase [Clostridia bacterium]
MITAFCLNPSFDKTVEVDAMTVGGLHRVRSSRTDPGGKGANVATVLARLGAQVRCLGLAGEDGAARYEAMLDAMGVAHGFLHMPGELRTNLKIVSLDGAEVTEINEPGPEVNSRMLESLLRLVRENCRQDDFLVLTGSLPPGCPLDTYARIMRLVPAPCVLDASGETLRQSLSGKPFLVSPNREELSEVVGKRLESPEEIRAAAMQLIQEGARSVLVTLGAQGAMLVHPSGTLSAPGLKVPVSSTVGAGDALAAGFVAGFVETGNYREALRRGMAAGAASVMTDGTQLIRPEDYNRLLDQVEIREV